MECNRPSFDIEEEYVKNDKLNRDDVKKLREAIKEHSRKIESTEKELFLFLHSNFYDIAQATNAAISYYDMRSQWPEVFRNRNPTRSPLRENLPISVIWPLKQLTSKSHIIMYAKLVDTDADKFDFNQQLKMYFAIFDFWLNRVGNSKGFIVIFDAAGTSWGHIPKFGLTALKKYMAYVQEAFPTRTKQTHVINANPFADKVFHLCKLFMHKKYQNLVHLHSNMDSLYKHIPKSFLPKDYGGDDLAIPELQEYMIKTLNENVDFFAKDDLEEVENTTEKFSYLDID